MAKVKNDLCKGKLMVECYLLVIFTRKDSRHRLMDSALIRWGNSCCTEKCIKISWDLIYLKQKKERTAYMDVLKKKKGRAKMVLSLFNEKRIGLYGCLKKKKGRAMMVLSPLNEKRMSR